MKTLEGMYEGKGLKIAIVASRFNEFITTKLVGGAEDCLLRHQQCTGWRRTPDAQCEPGKWSIQSVRRTFRKSDFRK